MVIIGFNSDMENYLSKRKKEYVPKKEVADEKPVKDKGIIHKITGIFSDEDEIMEKEIVENQDDEKAEKKGFISKIKGWLSFDDEDETDNEESKSKSSAIEDLKEALKIQNKWLKQLPSPVIREFKTSDDFRRYKEILEKYDLIKK